MGKPAAEEKSVQEGMRISMAGSFKPNYDLNEHTTQPPWYATVNSFLVKN